MSFCPVAPSPPCDSAFSSKLYDIAGVSKSLKCLGCLSIVGKPKVACKRDPCASGNGLFGLVLDPVFALNIKSLI